MKLYATYEKLRSLISKYNVDDYWTSNIEMKFLHIEYGASVLD